MQLFKRKRRGFGPSVARVELNGGSLDGPGTLTVTGAWVWGGPSTLQGSGSTIIGPTALATLNGEGDRQLSGRTLVNQGTLEHIGPCRLLFYNQARMENQDGGLVDLQGNVDWVHAGGNPGFVRNTSV